MGPLYLFRRQSVPASRLRRVSFERLVLLIARDGRRSVVDMLRLLMIRTGGMRCISKGAGLLEVSATAMRSRRRRGSYGSGHIHRSPASARAWSRRCGLREGTFVELEGLEASRRSGHAVRLEDDALGVAQLSAGSPATQPRLCDACAIFVRTSGSRARACNRQGEVGLTWRRRSRVLHGAARPSPARRSADPSRAHPGHGRAGTPGRVSIPPGSVAAV